MKTRVKKLIVLTVVSCVLIMASAYTDICTQNVYARDKQLNQFIILSKYYNVMDIGDEFQLAAITSSGKKPTFSSNKSNIASVNKYGLIRAKKSGKATITVKSCKAVAYCLITVNRTEIKLSNISINMEKGSVRKLTATISSGNKPKFSSSKSSVAKVDSSGNIQAVNSGVAIISVKVDGEIEKCTVNVKKPVITLESYKFTMKVGESKNLYAKVSNGYRPKYSSSNSKVIAITKSGQVAAIKKGKATITVSEGGTKVKCQISVEDR